MSGNESIGENFIVIIKGGDNMKRDCDMIQIEDRDELRDLFRMIDKYYKAYPQERENKTIKRLYDLLDMMDIEW